MISQEHTKMETRNAPVKSHLKRKISLAKSEPLNKSIKIGDDIKEPKINLNTMKKADLANYCEELLIINKNLMEENKRLIESEKDHMKTKENLEEEIKELKHNSYLCGECEYIAYCVHDFNDHTHGSEDLDNVEDSLFNCKFCDESFGTMPEVMKHSKLVHTSNVQHCEAFLRNICVYGDNCWFLHSETFLKSEPNFKCNLCEDKYLTKSALRKHMKKLHLHSISKCKNQVECKFGPKKCWFIHQEDIENAYHNAKCENQIKDKNIYINMT